MVLTLGNFVGFETEGLEELTGSTGAPVNVSSPVRSGARALHIPAGNNKASFSAVESLVATDGGDDLIMGFGIEFTDVTPGAAIPFLIALDDSAGATLFSMTLETNGNVTVDFNTTAAETITAPFTVDTYHLIEIRWQEQASGAIDISIDEVSELSVTGKDMDDAGNLNVYEFSNANSSATSFYIDDFYSYTGGSGTGDFLGTDVEVLGPYQNTAEDATDQGSTLDTGTWANTGELPVNDTNQGIYSTDPSDGFTRMDEGTRAGPAADIDGTPKGGKWIMRAERGTGGGSTHEIRYGKHTPPSTDSTTVVAITVAASAANFHAVSDNTSHVPQTSSDDFAMGGTLVGARDLEINEMWCMLLHVASAAPSFEHLPIFKREINVPLRM